MRTYLITVSMVSTLILSACGTEANKTATPQDQFFANLSAHCGNGYAGSLVSSDAVDADLAKEAMVMKVGPCSDTEIRVPFHVGESLSRTWVITRTDNGLRLKHRHGHEDGTEDTVSQYGGDTADNGTANRQEFPVDQFSKDLFVKEGLDVSVTNVWAIEVTPELFAYQLKRENRNFRVEFDLKNPIDNVPDPW